MALQFLKEDIEALRKEYSDDLLSDALDELTDSLLRGDSFIVKGYARANGAFSYALLKSDDEDGEIAVGIYTSEAEAGMAVYSEGSAEEREVIFSEILLRALFDHKVDTVVIDPFSAQFVLDRTVLWGLFYRLPEENRSDLFKRRMLTKAIKFAADMHEFQTRKGTGEPYITHPMEVMSIMNSDEVFRGNFELMIAGVLHDTVEDTAADIDTVRSVFGPRVAELVSFHTEDKSLSWDERKLHTIESLADADLSKKMLIACDLLANERSMLRDRRGSGEALWTRFKAPKEKIGWYHGELQARLTELSEYAETESIYRELRSCYEKLFVECFDDKEGGTL